MLLDGVDCHVVPCLKYSAKILNIAFSLVLLNNNINQGVCDGYIILLTCLFKQQHHLNAVTVSVKLLLSVSLKVYLLCSWNILLMELLF